MSQMQFLLFTGQKMTKAELADIQGLHSLAYFALHSQQGCGSSMSASFAYLFFLANCVHGLIC